jgi:preprotein translocase subunit SecG
MFDILRYLLVFVEVVCSALLLGVILIQKTRSQGMGLAFGAGMGESLFGAQMGNVLTKATVILAIVFLSNTIVLAWMGARVGGRTSVTEIVEAEPLPGGQPGMPGGTPAPVPEIPPVADVPAVPVTDLPAVPVPIIEGQPGAVETVPVVPEPPLPAAPEVTPPPVDLVPVPVDVAPAPAPVPVDVAPVPAPTTP